MTPRSIYERFNDEEITRIQLILLLWDEMFQNGIVSNKSPRGFKNLPGEEKEKIADYINKEIDKNEREKS